MILVSSARACRPCLWRYAVLRIYMLVLGSAADWSCALQLNTSSVCIDIALG